MGQESTPEKTESKEFFKTLESNGAIASLVIYPDKKIVFIEHIEAMNTGAGSGSKLLNKIKEEFFDYTIEGIAVPYDQENPHQEPTPEEIERFIFLEAEGDYRKLTDKEREFINDIRARHKARAKFSPHSRLRKFYRDNHFTTDTSGHFISKPPHTMKETETKPQ